MNSAPTEVEEAVGVLKGIVGTAVVLAGYPEDDETDAEFGRRVIKHRERIRLILSDYARLQSESAKAVDHARTALRTLNGLKEPAVNDGEMVAWSVSDDVLEDIAVARSFLIEALAAQGVVK